MTSEENEKEKLKGITQKTNQKEVEKYIEDEKNLNDNRKNLNSLLSRFFYLKFELFYAPSFFIFKNHHIL